MLRSRCQALAALECIIGGSQSCYAFDREWGTDEAALMSNGSGDQWAVVFTADGAFIRVFDHESAMTPFRDPDRELWPGLLDGMPAVFGPQVAEPAFGDHDRRFIATAVLWRLAGDDGWRAGDGMLAILLDDIVDRYVEFAEDYYEIEADRAAVEHIVARFPLTESVVRALNPQAILTDLHADLAVIGYPVAKQSSITCSSTANWFPYRGLRMALSVTRWRSSNRVGSWPSRQWWR